MRRFLLPVMTLWWREIIRFFRQRSRLISAFAQPLVFWLLLGAGLGQSFHPSGAPEATQYFEYLYAGIIVLGPIVYRNFRNHFDCTRSSRGFSSGCACRTGFKRVYRSRASARWYNPSASTGCSFSMSRARSGSELEYPFYRRNSRDNCFTLVWVDKPRLDDCLAYGFAARFSRYNEFNSIPNLDSLRRFFPYLRSARVF